MQLVEDPALSGQPILPPAASLSTPANLRDAVLFGGFAGYAEFNEDLGPPLVPPPHKTHYAIPFDINDDTDRGKYHPKTVSQLLFPLLGCANDLG